MAHMQAAGHVRRRQVDGIGLAGPHAGAEAAALLPGLVQAGFDVLGRKDLVQHERGQLRKITERAANKDDPGHQVQTLASPDLEPDRGACRMVRNDPRAAILRSEEHTSELQSLMRISYAVFCLKKKKINKTNKHTCDRQHNTQTTN